MNRWITAGLGGVGSLALAAAPLSTAVATGTYTPHTPYPHVEIVDTYAKTTHKYVVTKVVKKHKVVITTKKTHFSEAVVKVAYKCFTAGSTPKWGKVYASLQQYHGHKYVLCDGNKGYTYINLKGHGTLKPGYSWVKVKIVDPQGKCDYDAEKAKVHFKKVVKVVVVKKHW